MPRARATATIMRINGKLKAIPKVYTPEDDDIKKFKHDVAFVARTAFHVQWPSWDDDKPALETPIAIEVLFVFPRTKEITWKRKPMVRRWYADVPDLDNLQKALFDALNGVIYRDDRQVVRVAAQKIYANGTEPPAVHVTIQEIGDYPNTETSDAEPISLENQQLQEDQAD